MGTILFILHYLVGKVVMQLIFVFMSIKMMQEQQLLVQVHLLRPRLQPLAQQVLLRLVQVQVVPPQRAQALVQAHRVVVHQVVPQRLQFQYL